MLGDNRDSSYDSLYCGLREVRRLEGRIVLIFILPSPGIFPGLPMAPGGPVGQHRRSCPLKPSLPPETSKRTPVGRAREKVKWCLLLPGLLSGLTACDQQVQGLDYQIVRTLPHDSGAYTQGLVFLDGLLLESTGGYGTSSVRKTDLETGEVLQITNLDDEYFGEGLALVGRELYQLTWKSGLAFVYDLDSLALRRTLE
jgi:hypothetical protein